jgi:hypothetical protein
VLGPFGASAPRDLVVARGSRNRHRLLRTAPLVRSRGAQPPQAGAPHDPSLSATVS